VNTKLLEQRQPDSEAVMVVRVEEVEMDEMWSFVGSKQHQRWLWHAIDHQTGKVLAYVLATPEDSALKQLQQLLTPFSIERFYTDSWGAY
jgi:insertion element IS1 protein InsB